MNQPGRDAVDPDPVIGPLDGQRFSQPDNCGLGGAVVALHRRGVLAIDAGDVDDAPTVVRSYVPAGGLRTVKGPVEVILSVMSL